MQYIYIKTWGCQMNEYDSNIISSTLKKKKYKITKKKKKADILILNTCSIREKAQEKIFHQLGRWRHLKKKKKKIIIAVGGCVAEQEGKKIYKRANYVDIIFGTRSIQNLPKIIKLAKKKKKIIIDIKQKSIKKFKYAPLNTKKKKAIISIMEGCNKYCSFCIVPYTRGKEISRPYEEIIQEIQNLANIGVKEITLLGQNVNAYYDQQKKKICTFSNLLMLIAKIKNISRIRFITSHPIELTNDIINVYQKTPKLANFLHLPVQSGSNEILKKMKRIYNIKYYKKLIKKLISIAPYIQISSDFIIGFPGEKKKHFLETIKLIKYVNFDFSYSFIYSPRPGTKAFKIYDQTKQSKKKKRLYILQKKINKQVINWTNNMLGTIQRILVQEISKFNIMQLMGITDNNRLIHFYSKKNIIGQVTYVKIIKIYKNILLGILINKNI
ncbi:tRNA (N6-isopentenyl adenosine(37)-C2)-methylthiotransferase MiaB [Buchnera aphidicola (Mollitrichosiphum nigrofasciatum)]|uniref:tRNA (N6-isopentenyl adenosine(37)-C2)-methylthiotransferase MiaB n=1 Tax=Buchnera aphidicola TaxID=9 RepID=UPI0031B7EE34